jgi:hypothetical protein
MAAPIYLEITAQKNKLTPSVFIATVRSFWSVLQNVDAAVSNDPRGSVEWEIGSISKQSPAVLEFRGRSIPLQDNTETIALTIIGGIDLLAERKRPPRFSDRALEKTRLFAMQSKNTDQLRVYSDHREAVVRPQVAAAIDEFLGSRYESLGSVVGSLDSITVHRGSEFRVWSEATGKAVTCRFSEAMLEEVKSKLGERVLAYGDVNYNQLGDPRFINVDGIESYPSETSLPSIEKMSGRVAGIVDGLSIGDYMTYLRDAG